MSACPGSAGRQFCSCKTFVSIVAVGIHVQSMLGVVLKLASRAGGTTYTVAVS